MGARISLTASVPATTLAASIASAVASASFTVAGAWRKNLTSAEAPKLSAIPFHKSQHPGLNLVPNFRPIPSCRALHHHSFREDIVHIVAARDAANRNHAAFDRFDRLLKRLSGAHR